jgi:Uma2 family endonuclease
MAAIPLRQRDPIDYPESDGKPMAETEVHLDEMFYLIMAFKEHFQDAADVHVGGNLLFYYVEGDPRACTAPDCFVVRGSDQAQRRTWKLWEEGKVPCLVAEVTSRSTRGEDLKHKKGLYERLGVEEYILYDPLAEYLSPPLQGFQLVAGHYQPLPLAPDGSLASRTGVTLRIEDGRVRIRNTVTAEPYLRVEEKNEARRTEAETRRALEEEISRLREELKG